MNDFFHIECLFTDCNDLLVDCNKLIDCSKFDLYICNFLNWRLFSQKDDWFWPEIDCLRPLASSTSSHPARARCPGRLGRQGGRSRWWCRSCPTKTLCQQIIIIMKIVKYGHSLLNIIEIRPCELRWWSTMKWITSMMFPWCLIYDVKLKILTFI